MKDVLKTQGGIATWNMLDRCEGFLESIFYVEEVEPSERIGFFPLDTIEENDLDIPLPYLYYNKQNKLVLLKSTMVEQKL